MASQFYIVHHHFKPGMAGSWWGVMAEADEAAQASQAEKWLNMGYFNHCFMPLSQEGPMYCVWEVKDGTSEAEFQDFIDGPDGVCLLYTSPSPRDATLSRMPSSA